MLWNCNGFHSILRLASSMTRRPENEKKKKKKLSWQYNNFVEYKCLIIKSFTKCINITYKAFMGLAAKYDFKVRVIMVAIVSLMYITCCLNFAP